MSSLGLSPLTPTVKAVLVLDGEGRRIAVKYYDAALGEQKKQAKLESDIFKKTHRANARVDAEVLLFDKYVCLYKFTADVYYYVISGTDANELIVLSVLNCLEESVSNLLRGQVDKRTVVDNLDYLLLAIDEIIDDGLILETDSTLVTNRVTMKGAEKDVPLSEQSFSQALQSAKDQFVQSFR
eukprot:TRINITY_DN67015_c0_g1_i1.p1 TRINITY_DN67015_c0_g1~~TRINITY_DN67015_c0_g1_i1.p1  ORF type:complete len:198 (-),score=120.30 TRINITY_DN67015_c0_g1_i1:79-627(-)